MSSTQPGLLSTLRPMGLPPTPILSLLFTYALNMIATPRQYYGSMTAPENNAAPAECLARAETEKGHVSPEQLKMIRRAKGAAGNLQEVMPLYLVASLTAWLGGVSPEYQNVYHLVWLLGRIGYKYCYLNGIGEARSGLFVLTQIANIAMLIHGGNALHTRVARYY
ncbi:hypothetical protein K490DRAFT_53141 [Saccharata proteae CBS 121410]|uniref:Uncharacterized protein n=1 Tax=Saccharata proteae CBS 121410 TaxID=1314787 RepID=A0A9P4I1S7_9PEZI|nr:hypothetical protein K490DRAFT_53141 [Saccharata proteae CBS 121410]